MTRFICAALFAAFFGHAAAHEGHDHGDAAAKPADVRLLPRFEARSDDLEVVGVLAGKDLVIYVDRATDNAPVEGGEIEVEGPQFKAIGESLGNGTYKVEAAALAAAGTYPLTLTIQAGDLADLLSATLTVPEAAAPIVADSRQLWWWVGLPTAFAGLGLAVLWRRRRAS